MKRAPKAARGRRLRTLALDIGGTGLKAAILDPRGRMIGERERVETPHPLKRSVLVSLLAGLAKERTPYDRISVGFPGVVRDGVIRTAPNLGTDEFAGFNLARALAKRLGAPTRVINDADMQGYGAITGKGVEMVITLGTGFGSSIFQNGVIGPHLELAHHPFHNDHTYEDLLGDHAREEEGKHKWQKWVLHAVDQLRQLTLFDHLYIGGGNARHIKMKLPRDVSVVDNTAGLLGGIRLWARD